MRHSTLSRCLKLSGWLFLILLFACGPQPLVPLAMAQGHGHDEHGGHDWHGGGDHDWHGGGWHGGVGIGLGWGWPYYLDWPYYPYPYGYYPPPVYVPPVYAAPPVAPAPVGATWYYCANPPGYYPAVPACNVAWRPVAAVQ